MPYTERKFFSKLIIIKIRLFRTSEYLTSIINSKINLSLAKDDFKMKLRNQCPFGTFEIIKENPYRYIVHAA